MFQNVAYGVEYFTALDPDFILDLVSQLYDYVPIEVGFVVDILLCHYNVYIYLSAL